MTFPNYSIVPDHDSSSKWGQNRVLVRTCGFDKECQRIGKFSIVIVQLSKNPLIKTQKIFIETDLLG